MPGIRPPGTRDRKDNPRDKFVRLRVHETSSPAPCPAVFMPACTAPPSPQKPDPRTRITQAVGAPLTDLNLLRGKIPKVLGEAKKNPYLSPKDATCAGLSAEVQLLDEALGPDLDAPQSAEDPSLIEQGTTAAGDAAIDALKGVARLPLRHCAPRRPSEHPASRRFIWL